MAESFGARLRRQREGRGIDLLAIAEQTKIKISLLEALERDDVSRWPSGIFRRAYIRSYAHSIGLDPDGVLREFLEVHPEQDDLFASLATAPAPGALPLNEGPPTRLRAILDSAIASLGKLRQPVSAAPARATVNSSAMVPSGAPPPAEAKPVAEERFLDRESEVRPVQAETPAAALESAGAIDDETPTRAEEPAERSGSDARAPELPFDGEAAYEEVAHLCTAFGYVADRAQLQEFLQEAARVVTATGLIVWFWDEESDVLRPALAHGYSARVLTHLPVLPRDADNATAAAFRTTTACEVASTADTSSALVVPLLSGGDCVGALALELERGVQPGGFVRAVATVLAALLSPLVHRRPSAQQRHQVDRNPPGAVEPRSSASRRLTR